jgi:anti-anti-sigma factor
MPESLYAISKVGSVRVLEMHLPHALDAIEFNGLNEVLQQVITAHVGSAWVLDLSHMDYMGSATLGLIVNIRQSVKQAESTLVLCGLSPRLHQMFQSCSLERLFVICRTREEAIAHARR